jgi:hypothetical protein
VLTEEKMHETGLRLDHSPHKSLSNFAQEKGDYSFRFEVSSLLWFYKETSMCECEYFTEMHRICNNREHFWNLL